MSNPFLNYGTDNINNLTDGTANISINSAQILDLSPNLPVITDANKKLISSLITQSQVLDLVDDLTNIETIANTAQTTANTAQTTANNAQTTANNAQTTANTAQSTANTANTNATTALSTANTALITANNALPLAGGTMTGSINMGTNSINSTGTISAQSISSNTSLNADGLNMGATSGVISGSGGVTIQPIGGQSINLNTLGAGTINLTTAGTGVNINSSVNMQNNSLTNVASIAGGVSGLVSVSPVLAIGNLRFNSVPNRIGSLTSITIVPALNGNLSLVASGTGSILYTVDTGSFHQFSGDEDHNGDVFFLKRFGVFTNGNELTLDTTNISVPISIQPGGGAITCGGIITAPQYTCNFDHVASTNAYTSGVARFVTSALAPTIINNFGFTISANGTITPTWTGSRRCRITAMLGNGYSAGANDLNFQLWFQLSGTATNPGVGAGISYGLTRNTANTRFGQTYSNILTLVGGSSYQFAGSVNNTITYSQTLSVSIESLLS